MDLEQKRKKFLKESWPFQVRDFDHFWELKYNCFHCSRNGLIKNYRTIDRDITYIMCEYEDCDGSAIDMRVLDPIEDAVQKYWKRKGMPDHWQDKEWDEAYELCTKRYKEKAKKV